MSYEWVPIVRGQPLTGGSVMTGRTSTDGDVYVGRNDAGEIGKLNLVTDTASPQFGKMQRIWCHHGGMTERGMHLVLLNGAMQEWHPFRSGERLPPGAVYGGCTKTDGDVYVGRTKHGACGKVNLEKDGTIKNLWVHGNILPWKEGELLLCSGGGAPVAVAHAIPVAGGGMGGMWNPNAMCDGSRAEERAIWLQQNQGMSIDAARQKVMSEFPAQFGGGLSGPAGWNPNAICDGSRAEERAIWLRDNQGMSMQMAQQKVMQEFPGVFSSGGIGGGYGGGKVFNPNANCGGLRAEERVLWLEQNERLSREMACEKVMREFPGSF